MFRLVKNCIFLKIVSAFLIPTLVSRDLSKHRDHQNRIVSLTATLDSENATNVDNLSIDVNNVAPKTVKLIPINVGTEQIELFLAVDRHRAFIHRTIQELVRSGKFGDSRDARKMFFLELARMKTLEMKFVHSIIRGNAEDEQGLKGSGVSSHEIWYIYFESLWRLYSALLLVSSAFLYCPIEWFSKNLLLPIPTRFSENL